MEAIRAEQLTFFYPGASTPTLREVSLTVEAGSFVTLCGPSGCGKTTLLRQFKPALAPHGRRTGAVFLEGKPLEGWDARVQAEKVGFVLQSPEEQLVTDKVWHELAFGLENLGYDNSAIRLRVAEMASYFGIQEWFHRDVSTLSGGQKQLLNLAAVMAMQPSVLLLDEPTSQLDPIAAGDLLRTVAKLNRELGVTVLLSEHRLEEALPLSDRVIVMDGGRVAADGAPARVCADLSRMGHPMFEAMPVPARVWAAVEQAGDSPVTVREGRRWLEGYAREYPLAPLSPRRRGREAGTAALEMEQVWFRYDRYGTDIVKEFNFSVNKGELCALLGGNGAGKTTVLGLAAGLLKPDRGRVKLMGHPLEDIPEQERYGPLLGVLPQEPRGLFGAVTVEKELLETTELLGLKGEEAQSRLNRVSAQCELVPLLGTDPGDLSGGELQRAALAKLLLARPGLLLLDEPTKGLDARFKGKLAALLRALCAEGTAVLLVSHDVEFCASFADRCVLLFDGGAASQGPPETFFAGNNFYTTAANRMSRGILEGAVTAEDVILACGGTPPEAREEAAYAPAEPSAPGDTAPPPAEEAGKKKLPRRTAAMAVTALLLIPLTVWFGMAFLGEGRYYAVSLLVIFETMLPFVLLFEGRRPSARELVVLAVLCAIAVASRAALAWLPEFKPVTALVIVAGAAFGGESGFLVGAVSAFASNFFFQQGPWTPWQMLAWGLIGFFAGMLFYGRRAGRSRWTMCLYGGLSALVLYGGLMNTWDVLSVQGEVSWPMIWAACLRGLPMDLVHAAATVFFLLLGGQPMLDKLERVKKKYGF